MEKTFNLKRHLEKQAFYDGAQGHARSQTRAWMNCAKAKREAGMSPQEAWQSCLEEYQKGEMNEGWVAKYAKSKEKIEKEATVSGGDYQLQMGTYWAKLDKKLKDGMNPGKAVLEVLDECEKEGSSIPSR